MKNLFKKGAVATAVAGSLMISSMVSADSVLAPLVIGENNGAQTYFSLKARGTGAVNARMASTSDLHYVWFKKNIATDSSPVDSLFDLARPCEVSNNNGKVSPWDMVFQRAVSNAATAINGGQMNLLGAGNGLPALDASTPNGYTAGDFAGFAVITDNANKNANPATKDLANEGELSGFGYVVDPSNNIVLDYKLLNNHRSKVEGDFSAGFISKKSVDFSWFPIGMANTTWLSVVTGDDMLKADSGAGSYDATAYFSQDTAAGSVSPQLPTGGSGVYNNDEKVTSGAKNFKVTCIGVVDRSALLSTLQAADTVNGGWKRMSIQNSATRSTTSGSVATTQVASGAIVYKAEVINFAPVTSGGFVTSEATRTVNPLIASMNATGGGVFGNSATTNPISGQTPGKAASDAEVYDVSGAGSSPLPNLVVSFQPETSGHLSASPEPHPNRPY
ncbi:hypothetical protein [uncultured Thiothrix sp.]|uniref:hypothetical protein n=1 Tax=uncultured Thiothrix sp. TaxID=223185 RepID=UPI00261D44C8|nr:hypothetical protein [uncultured Thiothrix sp.]